ncbi:MAG: class I SAM-dependent methyltransferase [Syntrophomonas sp.]|nr:class I SAM-dependent methyltransferase [Syntrophomonas sp.]
MVSLSDRSNKYWSGRASEFSGLRMKDYESSMRSAYENFLLAFLPDNKKGISVLDLGTGAGFFAIILRKLGCQVTAVDFSSEMLAQAEINAQEKDARGISFIEMDAQNLTFPDNSFDFIITRNVTWVVEDAEKVYYHMHRVLKPGGTMINLDANYGKSFKESDDKGETPTHPTQTLEQLRERNAIAKECSISKEKRPSWDVDLLIDLGVSDIWVHLDLDKKLGLEAANCPYISASNNTKSKIFVVVAKKI